MATKSDLLEAQNFSRRRLLTAFVSGAPGGRELEPAKPLRAVIIGIALALVVILVGIFYGFLRSGLPDGWTNGRLVIDTSTGSRYVTIDGTLHPVLNTASARLLLDPANSADPLKTDSSSLAGTPVGATIGIPGAPDAIPVPSMLANTGWTACAAPDRGIDTRISAEPIATAARGGVATVVEMDGRHWIVSGDRRYEIPKDITDAVLRISGLSASTVREVSQPWLNLFDEGTALAPPRVAKFGTPVGDGSMRAGDLVRSEGSDQVFLVMDDGTLALLHPFSVQLYQSTKPGSDVKVTDVSPSAMNPMGNSTRVAHAEDWPLEQFQPMADDVQACALTTEAEDGASVTVLASTPATTTLTNGVAVDPSRGALVFMGGGGAGNAAILTLIDATSTAYAVPGAVRDDANGLIAKLGFTPDDVATAQASWLELFRTGPELTEKAAGETQ